MISIEEKKKGNKSKEIEQGIKILEEEKNKTSEEFKQFMEDLRMEQHEQM